MLSLYLARIEDLGRSDFVKVDCAACHHVALLTPEFLRGSGSARRSRCSTSKNALGAADAEPGDEPSFRSSGGGRLREPDAARRGHLALPTCLCGCRLRALGSADDY